MTERRSCGRGGGERGPVVQAYPGLHGRPRQRFETDRGPRRADFAARRRARCPHSQALHAPAPPRATVPAAARCFRVRDRDRVRFRDRNRVGDRARERDRAGERDDLLAAPARLASATTPFHLSAPLEELGEGQRHRRGDINRRIRADDDADEEHEGKGVDDVATEKEQRRHNEEG